MTASTTLHWVREQSPRWDEGKRAAFDNVGPDAVGLGSPRDGQTLADEWWRVETQGTTLGYGRLDSLWGDAEILLVVVPDRRQTGVGAFILHNLEQEAGRRGLNYLYNKVLKRNPLGDYVSAWLREHGFADNGSGELRKRVPAQEVR